MSPISMKTLQTLDFAPTLGPGEENHNVIIKEDNEVKKNRAEKKKTNKNRKYSEKTSTISSAGLRNIDDEKH